MSAARQGSSICKGVSDGSVNTLTRKQQGIGGWLERGMRVCVHTCACESLLACGCGYVRVFRRLLGADGWEWQKAREEGSIEIIRLPLKD